MTASHRETVVGRSHAVRISTTGNQPEYTHNLMHHNLGFIV